MSTPRRHGVRWSTQPAPATSDDYAAWLQYGQTGVSQPGTGAGVLQVDQVNGFLNALPQYAFVPFFTISADVLYDNTLAAEGLQDIYSFGIDQGLAYVFTDIYYYALVASLDRQGVSELLPPPALIGIVHFDFLISGNPKLRVRSQRVPAYQTTGAAQGSSGWPWIDRTFGSNRVPAFALYARGGETVDIRLMVETPPRFPIDRVGVEVAGFTVPDSLLEGIWDPTKRLK